MKRTLLILSCFTLALASCGGSDSSTSTADTSVTATTSTSTSTTTPMLPGEKLINTSDCSGCHNRTQKVVGPAYVEIAAKYPDNEANVALLTDKILKGGSGVWGEVPMTPHASLSKEDATEMVKYILTLKN
ncbi:c-type cytochrome [Pedobacter duraquae]|nr:c-type cytochrome [Pedobacter duraquae]